MDDRLLHIKFEGTEYDLEPGDLTVGRLRQMKAWFGAEYGRYLPFIQLLIQGDCDAVACAIWIVKKKAGERHVTEPRMMDFSVSDFFVQADEPEDGEDPPEGADPTPDSTPTLEPSEANPSGS